MSQSPIYLDYNATTPLAPEAAEAMRACCHASYGNPASQHSFGREARRKLAEARERIGHLLGAKMSGMDADQVLLTSGGTEANNLAVRALSVRPLRAEQRTLHPATRHLIVSAIEHPSIAQLVEKMELEGWHVDRLGVDERGVIRVDELPSKLRPDTRLVAAMLAHNETGVLQPIAELAEICSAQGIPLHTDAAQIVGKLPVDFRQLGASTLSLAAHKFHGPVGIGALVVRHGIKLAPQLFGGFQQDGVRPGTESLPLAVGMCCALERWHAEHQARAERLRHLRDRFERTILHGDSGAMVIGRNAERVPHTSNIAFVGIDRQALFMALDLAGVACSTGSACASGSSEPSPVHLAMGLEKGVVSGALRFSFGAPTTDEEVDDAARRILLCCRELRRQKQG